jgi:MORN repeat
MLSTVNTRLRFYQQIGGKYEGSWGKNQRDGRGRQIYWNGDKYYGDWESNERSGEGTCTFASGDIYSGQWFNDMMWGEGKYTKDGVERDVMYWNGINCDFSLRDVNGNTCLMQAVKENKSEAVDYILEGISYGLYGQNFINLQNHVRVALPHNLLIHLIAYFWLYNMTISKLCNRY